MKTKSCFILSLILIIDLQLSAQKSNDGYREMPNIKGLVLFNDTALLNASLISEKPITNREYITYLCWLKSVYVDYPERLIAALPGINFVKNSDSQKLMGNTGDTSVYDIIKIFLEISQQIVKDYNFNPKYLDFPVLNISWKQAMDFCNWLSDRYNESIFIKIKLLKFDPNQKDQECFTTESYLAGQYEGLIDKPYKDLVTGKERLVNWKDKILFPAFRLPTRRELKNVKVENEGKAYKSFEFLNCWIDFYLNEKENALIIQDPHSGLNIKVETKAANLSFPANSVFKEYYLDNIRSDDNLNIIDIYRNLHQEIFDPFKSTVIEKDSIGQMRYILIGEDKSQNPVYMNRVKYEKDSYGDQNLFRFAVSIVK